MQRPASRSLLRYRVFAPRYMTLYMASDSQHNTEYIPGSSLFSDLGDEDKDCVWNERRTATAYRKRRQNETEKQVYAVVWENSVKISGKVHFLKGQSEGETGTGKYVQFAVRQDSEGVEGTRKDFLVVRVYDEVLREQLGAKQEGDDVTVEGTLRSSRGSGVNYIRCASIA